MAILLTYGVIFGLKINDRGMGKTKKYLVVLFSPVMGFAIGSIAVSIGGPMVGAAIVGAKTEIPYIVTKFRPSSSRKCRNPITLDGLPWMFDELCGVSEEFGRFLEVGETVIISGRGTALGVIANTVRRGAQQ